MIRHPFLSTVGWLAVLVAAAGSPPVFAQTEPTKEPAVSKEESLKSAHEAERAFHKAIDAWQLNSTRGGDTRGPEKDIEASYDKYIQGMLRAGETPPAAVLVPHSFAFAGTVTRTDGTVYSVIIGPGQRGFMVSLWSRNTTGQPTMGIDLNVSLTRRAQEGITVRHAQVTHEAKRTVFRIPYALEGREGTVEIVFDGQHWSFHPDAGRMENGWWLRGGEKPG